MALKYALFPKTAGDDQNFAWLNCRPLTSKLKGGKNDNDELFVYRGRSFRKNSYHLAGRLLDGIREGVKWVGTEVFELLAFPTPFMV